MIIEHAFTKKDEPIEEYRECSNCTYHNPLDAKKCEICENFLDTQIQTHVDKSERNEKNLPSNQRSNF